MRNYIIVDERICRSIISSGEVKSNDETKDSEKSGERKRKPKEDIYSLDRITFMRSILDFLEFLEFNTSNNESLLPHHFLTWDVEIKYSDWDSSSSHNFYPSREQVIFHKGKGDGVALSKPFD